MKPLPLTFEGDDVVTVVQSLVNARKLIDLPESKLQEIAPVLYNDLDKVIRKEIRYHLSYAGYNGTFHPPRYFGGRPSNSIDLFLHDIHLLSKLSTRQDECFELLINEVHCGLTTQNSQDFIGKCDKAMLQIMKRHINQMGPASVAWDAGALLKEISSLRNLDEWVTIPNPGWPGHVIVYHPKALATSFGYLKSWIRRRYAKTVSYKVAGEKLPVELVELIAEQFYEKELLEKLEKEK